MNLYDYLYNYKPSKNGTVWTGWQFRKDYSGDCEDYARTIAQLHAGSRRKLIWNILTFKTVFWFGDSRVTKSNIPRHTVVKIGKEWYDSNVPNRVLNYQDIKRENTFWFPWLWLAIPLILWGDLYNRSDS